MAFLLLLLANKTSLERNQPMHRLKEEDKYEEFGNFLNESLDSTPASHRYILDAISPTLPRNLTI